jgi:hypothetical protein
MKHPRGSAKQSLRDFLRERCEMSDAELDKLEQGIAPDDPKALRKGASEGGFHPGFETMRKARELLDEIGELLARVERHDAERGALARGIEAMNGAGHNGLRGIDVKG